MKTLSPPLAIITECATFIGIDFHKRYSVYHSLDAAGQDIGKGKRKETGERGERGQGAKT